MNQEDLENESEMGMMNDKGSPLPETKKSLARGIVKSKTIWFNFAIMAVGFLESNPEFKALIPDQYQGLMLSSIGFIGMALRFITTDSLSQK